LPIMQALANQTAIALSNILKADRLKALYQADVHRYEEERLRLARELHDNILNQMAVLLMKNSDATELPVSFQKGYAGLTQQLREIVSDLRPPMLNYGLKPAIEELADNLMERSGDTVTLTVDLQVEDDQRFPENIEQHVYRILQQACENALRHGHARTILISGHISAEKFDIRLKDDGSGFEIGTSLDLDDLLAEKHFGLAGMLERSALIGASLNLTSAPGKGTSIQLTWNGNHSPD